MRYNMFGDAYCSSQNDIDNIMANNDFYAGDLYANISPDEDNPGEWVAEVLFGDDGETAFFIESFHSRIELIEALTAIGLSRDSINDL